MFDFPKVDLRDKTVINDAHITGHFYIFDTVTLKETTVRGVLHPGTFCYTGAELHDSESGPWKAYLAGGCSKDSRSPEVVHTHDEASGDDESSGCSHHV